MTKRLVSDEVDFTAPVNNRVVLARTSYSGVYGVFSGIDARRAIVPPMGLAYIAAVIREGSFQGDSILRGVAGQAPLRSPADRGQRNLP